MLVNLHFPGHVFLLIRERGEDLFLPSVSPRGFWGQGGANPKKDLKFDNSFKSIFDNSLHSKILCFLTSMGR